MSRNQPALFFLSLMIMIRFLTATLPGRAADETVVFSFNRNDNLPPAREAADSALVRSSKSRRSSQRRRSSRAATLLDRRECYHFCADRIPCELGALSPSS